MLRAVIVDDELSGINSLMALLKKHEQQLRVVATATKAADGITLIESYRPEVVFLDISMPGMDGFTMLKSLGTADFHLVFTTAHAEHAIRAIRHDAFDYLLKPLDAGELAACVDRIVQGRSGLQKRSAGPHTISLPVKDGIIFVRQSEIVRLEASGSYTVFHLENRISHVVSKSMKEYESQLDADVFFRCHNSHVINLQKVVKLLSRDGFFTQMSDGSEAEVSRKNKEELVMRLRKA